MTWEIALWICGGYVAFSVAFYFFSIAFASWRIYFNTFMRHNKEHWGRTVSVVTDETLFMDDEGLKWQEQYDAYKKDVHIVYDGLNLYGEYYDLGYDRAVIILSGRTESLRYGYYFAKPYSDAGYNVLVIDSRCHGYSDGTYLTLGFEESKDDLAWAAFLHDTYGLQTIVFHGICMGAAGGMLAITSAQCPEYIKGIVTEGMYANFSESMKNHLIERKKLLFPVMQCLDYQFKKNTGHSMRHGPIDVIGTMDKPLLMIQSKMDKYSSPSLAVKMVGLCPSKEKKLVLYEHGDHSMLRMTDTELYDSEVTLFLQRLEAFYVNNH